MTRRRVLLVWALLAVAGAGAAAGFDRASAERLVVRIESADPRQPTLGAGVVFNLRRGVIYVVTANHVVRRGSKVFDAGGGGASEVEWSVIPSLRVRFKPLPGEASPGEASPGEASPAMYEAQATDHWEPRPGLDLAVLRVEPGAGEPGTALLWDLAPALRLVAATPVVAGDRVWPVGHPGGRSWFVPSDPVAVILGAAAKVELDYNCLPGFSGGGLFDQRWRLAGIITENHTACRGVPFETVREKLREWDYAIDLEDFPRSPCAGPRPAAAWPESYDEGVAGLRGCLLAEGSPEACDWPCVIDRLVGAAEIATAAIEGGEWEKSDRSKRGVGTRSTPRLPYYQLGVAFFHSGNLAQARARWQESLRRELIYSSGREHKVLPGLIEIATARLEVERDCEIVGVANEPDLVRRCGEATAELENVERQVRSRLRRLELERKDVKALAALAERAREAQSKL